jgi:hypothetical protein
MQGRVAYTLKVGMWAYHIRHYDYTDNILSVITDVSWSLIFDYP